MAIDIVVQSLLRVDLFAGLKPLQLAEIARRSDRIVYKPGDAIITEGVIGDAAVLIVKGDAIRVAGPAIDAPEAIPEGSLLGEMSMLIETPYSSTVVAQGMTRAVRITREAILDQLAQDRSLADHLTAKLAVRLRETAQALREIDDALNSADEAFLPALTHFQDVVFARPQLH